MILRDRPDMVFSDDVRQRVLQSARELNYRLRRRRTANLGLVAGSRIAIGAELLPQLRAELVA
jgi:DNA-binding LacI/PurR family transcriptional regulator